MAFDKLKNLFNVDIKDGLRGTAVVQSSSMPSPEARSYNTTIWLDVSVGGREPYRVKHECMVKAGKHPWPGQTLPVVVDRENPERIDIQWEQLQTVDERMAAGGPAPTAAEPQVVDLRGTDLGEQLRGALAGQDRVTQLERLAKLRDSGVLSDAEFEAEKARILAG